MPKFCPSCRNEYQDHLASCPADHLDLVAHLLPLETFVDVYAAVDELEVERLLGYLSAEGIDARELCTGISQLPGLGDSFVIAVPARSKAKVKALIEEARRDNFISRAGNFL